MGDISETIERHQNIIKDVNSELAVMGLEKVGQKIAGKLLTPAVWALNYAVNGKTPDKLDFGLFGMGFLGGAAGPAAIVTGLVKAVVDDDMEARLKVVRQSEDAIYSDFIFPCYNYASAPPQINAMTIASMGGTAWQHPNGLWVYILCKSEKKLINVPNFKPKQAVQVYQPVWPLQPKGRDRFVFTINK